MREHHKGEVKEAKHSCWRGKGEPRECQIEEGGSGMSLPLGVEALDLRTLLPSLVVEVLRTGFSPLTRSPGVIEVMV